MDRRIFLPGFAPRPRGQARYELLVLSYGGGQDSTDLLLRWIHDKSFRERYSANRFLVLMSDTGIEKPETYDYINQVVQPLCHAEGIAFQLVTNALGYHSPAWPDLVSQYRRNANCGSKCFGSRRACTANLKLAVIYRYLEEWIGREYELPTGKKRGFYNFAGRWGKIGMMIGFAAGEEKRRSKPVQRERFSVDNIDLLYPLQDDFGHDRAACQADIRRMGYAVPCPSNCMICHWITDLELLWLARRYPQTYQVWVEIEQAKLEKFAHLGPNNYGVWGKNRTLPQVLENTERQHQGMSDDELNAYVFSHGHCIPHAI